MLNLESACEIFQITSYNNDTVPDSYLLHAFVIDKVAGSNVGRYISEFQHTQGIYTRTARIIYPVVYVKTYSC